MSIELQIKLWEIVSAYREHLLDLDWDEFVEFEHAIASTPGWREYENRMRPLWVDDLEELEDWQT